MLNWITRYQRILELFPGLLEQTATILEVGCGQIGMSKYLNKKIVGLEPEETLSLSTNLDIKKGSVLNPPFAEHEFDYVVCVDVLEHLSAEERPVALQKMLRLAKTALIIACPVADHANPYEQWLASWFHDGFGSIPNWLLEHLQKGLPRLCDLIDMIDRTGCDYSCFPNEGIYVHYAAVILDHVFPFVAQDLNQQLLRSPHSSLISGSDWDKTYSYVFAVHKTTARPGSPVQQKTVSPSVPRKESIGLYSFYHPGVRPIENSKITNVLCGDEQAGNSGHVFTDLPKRGGRLENKRWSELSGIYKLWVDQDLPSVIGLFHYRRILLPAAEADHHLLTDSRATFLQNVKLIDENALRRKCLEEPVVFAPVPVELGTSIYEHYATCHNEKDLAVVIKILVDLRPEFRKYIASLYSESRMFAWNMAVFRAEWFLDACELLFLVLMEFERQSPVLHRSSYQARDIAFLAERLLHLWLISAKDRLNADVIQVPILFYGSLGESGFANSRHQLV